MGSEPAWSAARLQSEILSQIIHGASVVLSKHNCTYSHSCCSRLLCTRVAEPQRSHDLGGLNTSSVVLSITENLAAPALCYTFDCLLRNSSLMVPAPVDMDQVIPIFLCPPSPIGISLLETLPKTKRRDRNCCLLNEDDLLTSLQLERSRLKGQSRSFPLQA